MSGVEEGGGEPSSGNAPDKKAPPVSYTSGAVMARLSNHTSIIDVQPTNGADISGSPRAGKRNSQNSSEILIADHVSQAPEVARLTFAQFWRASQRGYYSST